MSTKITLIFEKLLFSRKIIGQQLNICNIDHLMHGKVDLQVVCTKPCTDIEEIASAFSKRDTFNVSTYFSLFSERNRHAVDFNRVLVMNNDFILRLKYLHVTINKIAVSAARSLIKLVVYSPSFKKDACDICFY